MAEWLADVHITLLPRQGFSDGATPSQPSLSPGLFQALCTSLLPYVLSKLLSEICFSTPLLPEIDALSCASLVHLLLALLGGSTCHCICSQWRPTLYLATLLVKPLRGSPTDNGKCISYTWRPAFGLDQAASWMNPIRASSSSPWTTISDRAMLRPDMLQLSP